MQLLRNNRSEKSSVQRREITLQRRGNKKNKVMRNNKASVTKTNASLLNDKCQKRN